MHAGVGGDRGLLVGGERWADLAAIPLLSRHRADGTPLHALERDFRLAVRRLSAPRRGEAKLNVYYMLAEADADA